MAPYGRSVTGFEEFISLIEGLKAKHHLRDVLVGMEPTGHYWRKLAYFAKDHGYEVRFVRTTALKHHRELDESSSAKNDQRDALTIASITREGKYIDTVNLTSEQLCRWMLTFANNL